MNMAPRCFLFLVLVSFSAFAQDAGLKAVEQNGKWGYADQGGHLIISAQYDEAKIFSDGLAAVKMQGKWGFIDKTGQLVIPLSYDSATSFIEGRAWVNLNGEYGYIDKTGRSIKGNVGVAKTGQGQTEGINPAPSIPAGGAKGSTLPTEKGMPSSGDISSPIIKATYGANGKVMDVTTHVQSRVAGNQLSIPATNEEFGKDPIYGVVKTLTVRYRTAEGEKEASVSEKETLRLSFDVSTGSGTPVASSQHHKMKYEILMTDVDDVACCYVNNRKIAEVKYGEPDKGNHPGRSSWIDISDYATDTMEVRFTLWNGPYQGSSGASFKLRRNGEVIYAKNYKKDPDNTEGMRFDETIRFAQDGQVLARSSAATSLSAVVSAAQETDLNATLVKAAKNGDLASVKALLSRGANVNAKSNHGYTALMAAAENGHKDVCELLISKGANVNVSNIYDDTALMEAADKGHKDVCELLISKGADVNAENEAGWTALIHAADMGHKDVCELLISKGADVNACALAGITALMFAADMGHKDVCELFISKGADVNAKDKFGGTVLIGAAREGQKDVCKFLISKGADVNARNYEGKTALTIAAEYGHKDVCGILRAHGARDSESATSSSSSSSSSGSSSTGNYASVSVKISNVGSGYPRDDWSFTAHFAPLNELARKTAFDGFSLVIPLHSGILGGGAYGKSSDSKTVLLGSEWEVTLVRHKFRFTVSAQYTTVYEQDSMVSRIP
jgi:ankyrin repeat protein